MTIDVSDAKSNSNDQIDYAIKNIGRSLDRLKVFIAVHTGKKRIKTATEIANMTKLNRKRVLEEAIKLANSKIIKATSVNGERAYERNDFYYSHKARIVSLIKNPKKQKNFPTKYSVKVTAPRVTFSLSQVVRTASISIDDIDSFRNVQGIKSRSKKIDMLENDFKQGIKRIIGEPGEFKDWGGESSDLYSTRLRLNGRRRSAAMAFKGRGITGILTPARMGKNGDQIQRLFQEDAEVFLIQYNEQIASSVRGLMAVLAQTKSLQTGKKIYYGTIDGEESARLIAAYPEAFKTNS